MANHRAGNRSAIITCCCNCAGQRKTPANEQDGNGVPCRSVADRSRAAPRAPRPRSVMDALLSGGGFDFAAAAGFASSQQNGFLPAHEAERVVESLREFTIEDVGSPAWSSQRQSLERLNVQAHHNAVTNSDEFVKEFLVSHDKVATLVHELLVIEAWNANVFMRVLCTHRSPHDRVGAVHAVP